jgi:replicative DNA helicase
MDSRTARGEAVTELLEAALAYAARGWQVLPLHTAAPTPHGCSCAGRKPCKAGKHPRTLNGLRDASADPQIIRRWWEAQWPTANLGIVTGAPSGLVVVDLDSEKGGEESLESLQRRYGRLPETVEALTGGGGRHLLFRHPGQPVHNKQSWRDLPGLDIRGDGGYIVAPPSLHASGRRYEWEASSHPEDVALAELPDWLCEVLTRGAVSPAREARRLARDEGAPAPVGPILQGCGWLRHCVDDGATLGEAAWYAMLTIAGRCEDGDRLAHAWSKAHPGYHPDETEAKLRHALADTGPYTCAVIRGDLDGEPYCAECLHWGRTRSPIALARGMLAEMEAPPEDGRPPECCSLEDLPPLPAPEDDAPAETRERQAAEATLPHSLPAERALLGLMLEGAAPVTLRKVLERLTPPDFYDPKHDALFAAIRDLVDGRQPVDRLTLLEHLGDGGRLRAVGGADYLEGLLAEAARDATAEHLAETIRKKSELRALLFLLRDKETECLQPGAEPGAIEEDLVRSVLLVRQPDAEEAVCYAEVLRQETERIERGESEPALLFGLREVDRLTGGLGRAEVGIVCGRPGTGKSVFCAMQLHEAGASWGPVLYISLEMGAAELVRRDLAGLTNIGYRDLREAGSWDERAAASTRFNGFEIEAIRRARERLLPVGRRMWIDEHASTLTRLVSRVHRYRLQHGIEAVIVDYGQLVTDDMAGRGSSKAEEVMRVARALKNEIATPAHIPVWVAVQANRESEGKSRDQKPKLLGFSDLGWSSEWEAVAGRIVFLNPHPEYSSRDTETTKHLLLDVAKNRHGAQGRTDLVLHGPRFQFAALERRDLGGPE